MNEAATFTPKVGEDLRSVGWQPETIYERTVWKRGPLALQFVDGTWEIWGQDGWAIWREDHLPEWALLPEAISEGKDT